MPETVMLAFLGLALLAAASHRFRREAGATAAGVPTRLRVAGWLLLLAAAIVVGGGEAYGARVVRLLGAMSIAGALLVLLLSARPLLVMGPIARVLNRR